MSEVNAALGGAMGANRFSSSRAAAKSPSNLRTEIKKQSDLRTEIKKQLSSLTNESSQADVKRFVAWVAGVAESFSNKENFQNVVRLTSREIEIKVFHKDTMMHKFQKLAQVLGSASAGSKNRTVEDRLKLINLKESDKAAFSDFISLVADRLDISKVSKADAGTIKQLAEDAKKAASAETPQLSVTGLPTSVSVKPALPERDSAISVGAGDGKTVEESSEDEDEPLPELPDEALDSDTENEIRAENSAKMLKDAVSKKSRLSPESRALVTKLFDRWGDINTKYIALNDKYKSGSEGDALLNEEFQEYSESVFKLDTEIKAISDEILGIFKKEGVSLKVK